MLAVSGSEGAAFYRAPVRQQLVGRWASSSGFRKHHPPSYLGHAQLPTQRQPQPVGMSLPENLALPLTGSVFCKAGLMLRDIGTGSHLNNCQGDKTALCTNPV